MAPRTLNTASLRFIHWNADGLKNKIHELRTFMQEENPDALTVSETHFKLNDRAKIEGYTEYRDDRQNRPGGGTAIYIKSTIAHTREVTPTLTNLEATIIRIFADEGRTIRLAAGYNPPNSQLTIEDLGAILNNNTPTILAGDLNAKHQMWNSRNQNRNGRILHRYANNNDCQVDAPITPTHHQGIHRPDVLDIAILRGIRGTTTSTTITALSSGHSPVLVETSDEDREEWQTIRKRTDWISYKNNLKNYIGPVQTITNIPELEKAVEQFTDAIIKAKNAATRNINNTDQQRLPRLLRELIKRKNQARRRYQRNCSPQSRAEKNRLQNEVSNLLRERAQQQWEQLLQDINMEDGSLWSLTKSLRKTKQNIPPLQTANGLAYQDAEKTDALAESMEKQFCPNMENGDEEKIEEIKNHVSRYIRRKHEDSPQ